MALLSPSVNSVLFELEFIAGEISLSRILSPLFTVAEVISPPVSLISNTHAHELILTEVAALIHDTKNSRIY